MAYKFTPIRSTAEYGVLAVGGFVPSVRINSVCRDVAVGTRISGGPGCPGYASLIGTGRSATTDRSVVHWEVLRDVVAWQVCSAQAFTLSSGKRVKSGYLASGAVGPLWFRPTKHLLPSTTQYQDGSVTSAAAVKFREAAREKVQSLNAGTVAVEIKETVNMLLSPGKALLKAFTKQHRKHRKLIRKAKRRRWSRRRIQSALDNQYLQFQFGVAPLLSDIDSAAKAAAEFQYLEQPTISVRHRGPVTVVASETNKVGYFTESFTSTVRTECEIKGAIHTPEMAPPASIDRFLQESGLDGRQVLRDFIPTMYEAFPFSFVLDYFSNLQACITDSWGWNPSIAWSSTTTNVTSERRLCVRSTSFNHSGASGTTEVVPPWSDVDVSGEFHERRTSSVRSSVIPQIRFHLEIPSLKQGLNLSVLADALTSRK